MALRTTSRKVVLDSRPLEPESVEDLELDFPPASAARDVESRVPVSAVAIA